MQPYQRKFLEARYGFRAYSADCDPEGTVLDRAKAAVEAFVERPIEFSRDEVLWNDDFIFVPWGWVGCSGYLVHRRTQHVISLGTSLTPDEWVWAIYRGCDVDSWRKGCISKDTLAITAVHDRKALLEALWWYRQHDPRFADFDRQVQKHPWKIRKICLIYAIRGLMQAERRGDFEFEINPPGGWPYASKK